MVAVRWNCLFILAALFNAALGLTSSSNLKTILITPVLRRVVEGKEFGLNVGHAEVDDVAWVVKKNAPETLDRKNRSAAPVEEIPRATDTHTTAPKTKIRGTSVHRQTRDIEGMLNEMSNKAPEEWSGAEWFIFILLVTFFGWLACCLCTLFCCGGSSDLLGWFCLWEICCRDGRDIDRCCDYSLA